MYEELTFSSGNTFISKWSLNVVKITLFSRKEFVLQITKHATVFSQPLFSNLAWTRKKGNLILPQDPKAQIQFRYYWYLNVSLGKYIIDAFRTPATWLLFGTMATTVLSR